MGKIKRILKRTPYPQNKNKLGKFQKYKKRPRFPLKNSQENFKNLKIDPSPKMKISDEN